LWHRELRLNLANHRLRESGHESLQEIDNRVAYLSQELHSVILLILFKLEQHAALDIALAELFEDLLVEGVAMAGEVLEDSLLEVRSERHIIQKLGL